MNPFSGYGGAVEPERFVGRAREAKAIRARVLQEGGYGSIAIIGEARIGKTSLMCYPFEADAGAIAANRCAVVNIGSIARLKFEEPTEFFLYLAKRAHRELSQHGAYTAGELYERAIKSSDFATEGLFDYLQAVKADRLRLIYLLDEFDAIRRVLGNHPEPFHALREMGYNYLWKVAFVVASRVSVGQMERSADVGISTLSGIFQDINLGLMEEADCRRLIQQRTLSAGVSFEADEVERILAVAGHHPFFIEILSYHLYDAKEQGLPKETAFAVAIEQARPEFFRTFDSFRARLGPDRFDYLLRATAGQADEDMLTSELLRLGHLVRSDPDGSEALRPFGGTYQEYLAYYAVRMQRPPWIKDGDLWNLIRQTETRLRGLIRQAFENQYAERWEDRVTQIAQCMQLPNSGPTVLAVWQKRRQDEQHTFRQNPGVPLLPLLDYSYIGELGQIMGGERWSLFKAFFKEKSKLDRDIAAVARVRNPVAHFREDVIPENEADRAKVACRDILLAMEPSDQNI